MITEKELMIGNYVLFDTWICKVDQINPPYINISHEGHKRCVYIDKLQPIPITKELLDKNGFEVYTTGEDYCCNKTVGDYKVSFILGVSNPTEIYIHVFGKEVNYFYGGLTRIQYVHQVQNLMNILGVELELEL